MAEKGEAAVVPAETPGNNNNNNKTTIIKLNGPKQCPTKGVTVYSDRAEITRLVSFLASNEGEHSVVVDGLSNHIDEASIHVSGGVGDATILEVSYRKRFEPVRRDESESSKIRQQIEELDEQIHAEENNLDRTKKEADWLFDWSKRMSETGAKSNVTDDKSQVPIRNPFSDGHLEQTEKFLEFYERMTTKNDAKRAAITKQIKGLLEKKKDLSNAMHGHVIPAQEKREVIISVHVGKPGLIELSLSYVVHGASWVANYDVRVSTDTGTHLVYYGTISNNTNEEWLNASLSLSTASPASGGSPPELSTLRVEFQEELHMPSSRSSRALSSASSVNPLYSMPQVQTNAVWSVPSQQSQFSIDSSTGPVSTKAKPGVSVLTADSSEGVSSASFTIPRTADIPADGQPHKVTIAMITLSSRFTNVCVPKKTQYSYLKATITNTSQLPFLEGDANVFMDMNFVARSRLQYVPAGENFAMYLGVDNSVRVDRKADKKQNETTTSYIISKSNVRTMRHESIVKNSKNTEAALVLYEQLPLSTDEKIKVKLISPQLTEEKEKDKDKEKEKGPSTRIHINHDNILEWRTLLPAKSETPFVVEYTVEWPKDKNVHIN